MLCVISKIPGDSLTTFGSDLILSAASQIIQSFADCDLLGPDTDASKILSWISLLETSLCRTEAHLRTTAALAYARLVDKISPALFNILKYIDGINTTCEQSQRCGYTQFLGQLPPRMLAENHEVILPALVRATEISSVKSDNFAECRRDAVNSLVNILKVAGSLQICEGIAECFLNGMNDYAVEARGDVGSWIRDACCTGFETLLDVYKPIPPQTLRSVICEILLTCCEKIDRLRENGGVRFLRLLESDIEFEDKHKFMYLLGHDINWLDPKQVYPLIVQALGTTYQDTILLGYVLCIGGLTETLVNLI